MAVSTQAQHPRRDRGPRSAEYQLASDGYDGSARSGVIRQDGKWIPAEAGNPDWYAYMQWLREDEDNRPAPYASPKDGGIAIRLAPNQSAVGVMKDSIDDEEMPMPPEEPRRMHTQADMYNPPAVPTDHSQSPAREQRGDAFRPLTDNERQMRDTRLEWNRAHPAEIEGVWTQEQADNRRHFHENARREREEMVQKAMSGEKEHIEALAKLDEQIREFEREEALRRQPTAQAAEEMPSPSPGDMPQQHRTAPPPHRPTPPQSHQPNQHTGHDATARDADKKK